MTCHTATMTPAQTDTVAMLRTSWVCETWHEDDGALGIAFTDDGRRMVGYIDRNGRVDWQ